jgi:mono/diheme cytochrome c family protein
MVPRLEKGGRMSRWTWCVVGVLAASVPGLAAAQASGNREHGRYLVENVAMCVQCHTPRDASGVLLLSEHFMGASVPISAPGWAATWAFKAPRIARMPGYTEASAVRLLTTGISRTGQTLMPPMPPFRMSEQDAKDIFAYLSSLGPDPTAAAPEPAPTAVKR